MFIDQGLSTYWPQTNVRLWHKADYRLSEQL
jgi:hypothetical protein